MFVHTESHGDRVTSPKGMVGLLRTCTASVQKIAICHKQTAHMQYMPHSCVRYPFLMQTVDSLQLVK